MKHTFTSILAAALMGLSAFGASYPYVVNKNGSATNLTVVSGTISGNGAGLTNLHGTNIQSGTINSNKLDAATKAQLALGSSSETGATVLTVNKINLIVEGTSSFVATNVAPTVSFYPYLLSMWTNIIGSETNYARGGQFFETLTNRIGMVLSNKSLIYTNLAIIQPGMNDWVYKTNATNFASALTSYVWNLHSNGIIVALCTLWPRYDWHSNGVDGLVVHSANTNFEPYRIAYNNIIRSCPWKDFVVDFDAMYPVTNGFNPPNPLIYDGDHPNEAGARWIAHIIDKEIPLTTWFAGTLGMFAAVPVTPDDGCPEISIYTVDAKTFFTNGTPFTLLTTTAGSIEKYFWYQDGNLVLAGLEETRYAVAAADATNSGVYTVVASNVLCSVTSAPFTVEIVVESSSDADVDDFIVRTSIDNATEFSAISNLVVAAKLHGWWQRCDAIYPFVGSNAVAHAQNLKADKYNITWSAAGVTNTGNGLRGNGTTGYGDTGFNIMTNGTMLFDQNSAHLFAYVGYNGAAAECMFGATHSTFDPGYYLSLNATGPTYVSRICSGGGAFTTYYPGPILVTRTNASFVIGAAYENQAAHDTTNITYTIYNWNSTANSGTNFWVMRRHIDSGSSDSPATGPIYGISFGSAIQQVDVPLMFADWENFQNALSRNP